MFSKRREPLGGGVGAEEGHPEPEAEGKRGVQEMKWQKEECTGWSWVST